ncbi:MAG: AgmX/PglI C-terminal domain-containing protein [Sandaracinus sp.]|nr:AgmX/PglI C-terminal domain-containing protein [Sandaracinus sp.]
MAATPSADSSRAPGSPTTAAPTSERPPVWYLPPGRYQAHGARVTDGDDTVTLWGDWPLDVRADGARYHVELALGGSTRTWTLVSRLELHVCANDALRARPERLRPAGTRLYLRGARPDDVTVATSPAMPAPTFNVPLDAVSIDACTREPFTPASHETEARAHDERGVVPVGTPIVPSNAEVVALHLVEIPDSWAFEADSGRWWLLPRDLSHPTAAEAPTPETTNEAPTADDRRRGALSKRVIRVAIREGVPHVRACYQSRLAMLPDLEGRLEIRFLITPSGEVGPVATIESPGSLDLAVEVCVARVVKSLRFPPPNGGGIVIVTYPFVLAQRATASASDENH